MKHAKLVGVLLIAPVAARAQAVLISHHGRLLDGEDRPIEGLIQLEFDLYKNAQPPGLGGPDDKWWDGQPVTVTLYDGLYALTLGDPETTGALPPAAFAGPGVRWLQITVGGVALEPRLPLGIMPDALHAALADEALHAARAGEADALGAVCAGCVGAPHIAGGSIGVEKLARDQSGKVAGLNADALDGLDADEIRTTDASLLTTGTLPGGRLAGTYANAVTLSNAENLGRWGRLGGG